MIFLEAYILNEQTIVNINELKYLFLKSKDINISVFKMSVFFCWVAVPSNLAPNGYVYETFGISKHLPVKLQVLLIRAEMLDNTLTAKCFIYDVGHWLFYLNQNLKPNIRSVF